MYVCEKQHMLQWQPYVIESLRAETGSHWHGLSGLEVNSSRLKRRSPLSDFFQSIYLSIFQSIQQTPIRDSG